MDLVRKMVSKKKRRFEWGNFDLDLSYITDRIIAMGFPSESIEGLYRNRMKDVQRFLNTLHQGHYKVYNLCSERKYEKIRFDDRVSEYPFDDHSPPNLNMITEFCRDIEQWLDKDPENIVAIHCKAGKGRTGTMIACWLLFNRQCQTGSESMRVFANKRTHNGKGVTIPSQIRYVRYFEALLQYGRPVPQPPQIVKVLSMIRMNSLPNFNIGGGCEPYLCIVQQDKAVFYSKPIKLKKGTQQVELDCGNILLSNDVKFEFYNKNSKGHMFSYCFHTAFVEGSKIHIRRQEIDKAHKDLKHFASNFSIELFFLEDEKDDDTSSISEESIDEKRIFNTSYATGLAKLYHNNNIIKSSQQSSLTSSTTSTSALSPELNNSSDSLNNNNSLISPRPRSSRNSKLPFICPKCKFEINPNDATINRDNENYHWKCITCNRCKKTLGSNCLFEGNESICIDCGTESGFFKSCSGCNLVIKTTDYEEFGNLIYHRSCFLCFWCHSFLADREFIITVNSKLLKCSECIKNHVEQKDQLFKSTSNNNLTESTNYNILDDPIAELKFNDRKLTIIQDKTNNENNEIINQEITKLVQEIDDIINPTTTTTTHTIIVDTSNEEQLSPSSSISANEILPIEKNLICTKCNLSIINQRPVILDCGIWHRSCFSCYECNDDTPMDPSLYYIRNDKPICFDCDVNHIVNEAHCEIICNGCKLSIKDDEMMDALGYKWHVHCLVCETCKCPIEGQFGEHQGLIYCKDHFEVGPKCDHCNKFIDGMYLKVNGKQLHQACFTCTSCLTVLEGGRYFEKNGVPICENCRQNDILKRKTQIQLQHSLINSFTQNNLSNDQLSYADIAKQQPNSIANSNSSLSESLTELISELSTSTSTNNKITNKKTSPSNTIEKEGPIFVNNSKNKQLFRNSVKIRLEDLKNSGERKTQLYPSFHRHMQKHTFKAAYPTLRGRRKDFLNQLKKLESESSQIELNNNNKQIISPDLIGSGFETI